MSTSFPIATFNPRSSRAGVGGPKTAAGKARSAVNAVKHGLTSTNPVVLEFETLEAWEAYRDAFVSDLHPVGQVEAELALELALIQWRRRRVAAYEARAIDSRIQAAEPSHEYYAGRGESPEELEARAAAALNDALLPDLEAVQRLLRYEAHLDCKFNNTLRQLERLQKARREQAAENCKTSSAPHLQDPVTSVPCVASVASVPSHPPAAENCKTNSPAPPPVPPIPSAPSDPTRTPANRPHTENYETNSVPARNPPLAQPAPDAACGATRQTKAPESPESPERGARSPVVPLAAIRVT